MKNVYFYKFLQIFAGIFVVVLIINCSSDSDASSSQGTPVPIIAVTGSFGSFGPIDEGTVSVSQNVQVSANNLIDILIIKAPSNFAVSLDDTTFTNQVTLSKDEANSGFNTVYVRFSPVLSNLGVLTGNITFESNRAAIKSFHLNGRSLNITPLINVEDCFCDFGDVTIMQDSAIYGIELNGDNLVSDLNIEAPGEFKVSLDNITYSDSVQIPADSANDEATVYVRFSPTIVGSVLENLSISNAEADNVSMPLQGNGIL